jgi:hypothetical protein
MAIISIFRQKFILFSKSARKGKDCGGNFPRKLKKSWWQGWWQSWWQSWGALKGRHNQDRAQALFIRNMEYVESNMKKINEKCALMT